MTTFKLGDKIRYTHADFEYNGIEGIVTDVYSQWVDILVTKAGPGKAYLVDDEAYGFSIDKCTLIESGDGAGNPIEFAKVKEGDTIKVTFEQLGIKFTKEGTVGSIESGKYLVTPQGGTLAFSDAGAEILLLKKGEPLKDAPVGKTFEHKVGANTNRYRKAHKDYWIAETTDEWGNLVNHFTINNSDIHQTYEMVEEQQKIKREAVPLPPTGRNL